MKRLLLALLLTACTVVPKQVPIANLPSIGLSGKADSGIVALIAPPQAVPRYAIDQGARERFNALIETYGREPFFQPPLVKDTGIHVAPNGDITMDRQAMRHFALMNQWRRAGRIPLKQPNLIQRLIQ